MEMAPLWALRLDKEEGLAMNQALHDHAQEQIRYWKQVLIDLNDMERVQSTVQKSTLKEDSKVAILADVDNAVALKSEAAFAEAPVYAEVEVLPVPVEEVPIEEVPLEEPPVTKVPVKG